MMPHGFRATALGDKLVSSVLEHRCNELAEELGLGTVRAVTPLSGGVASDIAVVDVGALSVCMKFALAKLKVAEDWRAPVHRNRAEYAWLQAAAAIVPASAVRLFGRSEELHGFAMEYLDGPDVRPWKTDLLQGHAQPDVAAEVGDALGQIHAASTRPDFDRAPFHNRADFQALRLEPYLSFTAGRHPAVREPLVALVTMLDESERVLVHGDVSPKNILLRPGSPVLLDAECATLGDPSFDVAFCLNHLVLKAIHVPSLRQRFQALVRALWEAYVARVGWEPVRDLEARVCRLLPALMLARVDGKSPIEYLTEAERDQVRCLALAGLRAPAATLDDFARGLRLMDDEGLT